MLNNSPITMNNNYVIIMFQNRPLLPFNSKMNNSYCNININESIVMSNGYSPPLPSILSAIGDANSNF